MKGRRRAKVSIHGWKNQTPTRKARKLRPLFTLLSQFSTLLHTAQV
jgi:hypothetical protein